MLGFSRREFLLLVGLSGAAVALPAWLRQRGQGGVWETAVAQNAVAPLVEQPWGFDLAFPAYFPVLPAVIDPTPSPTATIAPSPTPSPSATATGTPASTPTATATSVHVFLPLVGSSEE